MRVPSMVGALLTTALITGCQASTTADEEEIREAIEAWAPAYNARNADTVAAYYTEDSVRILPNLEALQSREAIRAALVEAWDSGAYAGDAANEISFVHASGDLGVARGSWTETATPADGESFQDRGYWTAVFQRQGDGSWECLWDIVTSALPPRPPR